MAIFFIAAIGLLLLFLFLQGLSHTNRHLLSDVLKGTSATLLVISFILFILSGRVLHATFLAGLVAVFVLPYRKHWKKNSSAPAAPAAHLVSPLTLEEACTILGLDPTHPLLKDTIESAYQKKIQEETSSHNRWYFERAKDFLITSLDKNLTSPGFF